jgi:hypothetical protein
LSRGKAVGLIKVLCFEELKEELKNCWDAPFFNFKNELEKLR